jgi:hypothetical protein
MQPTSLYDQCQRVLFVLEEKKATYSHLTKKSCKELIRRSGIKMKIIFNESSQNRTQKSTQTIKTTVSWPTFTWDGITHEIKPDTRKHRDMQKRVEATQPP